MKRILVLCDGNSGYCQMAETYLLFFAPAVAEVHTASSQVHPLSPLVRQAMAEDNLDLTASTCLPMQAYAGEHFDVIIDLSGGLNPDLPDNISADQQVRYHIPAPDLRGNETEEEQLAICREQRESVKKFMLRFIGQELIGTSPSASRKVLHDR